MPKVILVENHSPPYNTRVIYPAYNDDLRDRNKSDDDVLQDAISRNLEVGVISPNDVYHIINEEEIPDESILDMPYRESIFGG